MGDAAVPDQTRLARLFDELRTALQGEVRADRLIRALYATDASIYEIVPDGVVIPRSVADVAAAVRLCGEHGVPVTARGAGTGLTGGAVNRGVVLDCSRHLNRILAVDPAAATARVEPGVVLDDLNAALKPHGLHFAPDVATSSRATLGGMIANNSCGARSRVFGRTVDHLLAVDVVLSDGSTCTLGPGADSTDNVLAQRCERTLGAIAREYADDIAARFPKVARRNAGYALDRVRTDHGRVNVESIICGSEGTLAVVVGATLKLTPLPRWKGLVIVHFDELLASLEAVPAILEHQPAAVELVDRPILDATKANPALRRHRGFIDGDPAATLAVEFFADGERQLAEQTAGLAADLRARNIGYSQRVITDAAGQADVWTVRKAGLGLHMSKPGDRQPYAFIEDAAVEPARLAEYIRRVNRILDEEGVEQAGCYAHASVGVLHVRPVLNLKDARDVEAMRRIADRVSSLVFEFGGSMSGEHGDGLVRSCWLGKMFGPRIVEAFGKVKQAFDPDNVLNPGKIVAAPDMTENLRFGAGFEARSPATSLDFGAHGGPAGLAAMCTGVGQCRQRNVGTMCPSYMATGDELHGTRARANALRLALSNRNLLEGLSDPALEEVMDLCLGCKACKTECPTGTDMAKLKAEWLAYRNRTVGVPRRSRLVAATADLAEWGSAFAPVSNWVLRSLPVRLLMEHVYGLDRRVPPPRFARPTFRQWFARRLKRTRPPNLGDRPGVVYFVDTWTNFYVPEVGQATVKVLEAMGWRVIVPPTVCCGRPLVSKGLLAEAQLLASANVGVLAPFAVRGTPIVVSEPSCLSMLIDEWPQLVRTVQAQRIAGVAAGIETFVARELERNPSVVRFEPDGRKVLFHGHCHQKVLTGTADALTVLGACSAGGVAEIDSGCCGMAGAFGHEVEHYEVARAVGEERLFPAVRGRGHAEVAITGFSCRHQIEHHTGARPRHAVEFLAGALA